MDERRLLRSLLKPGMTVVDVGANIGYYLLLFKQACGNASEVICIEPSVENLPELKQTIQENGFGAVSLHEVALGDHEGEVGLQRGINSGVVEGEVAAPYFVPLRRLDVLVERKVEFLKIDVEGYEGQVLAGARGLIETHRPILFLELHAEGVPKFGYSLRGILDSLATHYTRIELFEKRPPAELSAWSKIAIRYLGFDALRPVEDAVSYVARHDANPSDHTFWAVCHP